MESSSLFAVRVGRYVLEMSGWRKVQQTLAVNRYSYYHFQGSEIELSDLFLFLSYLSWSLLSIKIRTIRKVTGNLRKIIKKYVFIFTRFIFYPTPLISGDCLCCDFVTSMLEQCEPFIEQLSY